MADKPFTIIGVNSDQDIGKKDLDHIRNVIKEKKLTWRSFQNTSSEVKISTTWNVKGWPTTYLIDKDGTIRYKNVRGAALDEALEELMAEMGQPVSLIGVDHEAEDKVVMEAAKKEAEEAAKKEADSDDTSEKSDDADTPDADEESASDDKAASGDKASDDKKDDKAEKK